VRVKLRENKLRRDCGTIAMENNQLLTWMCWIVCNVVKLEQILGE